MGCSVEEANAAKCGDWQEETRYVDGGYDFRQIFENPETQKRFSVRYCHVSDKAF